METNDINNIEYHAPESKEKLETINPTPDNPPWNVWAAFGVWIASVLFIVVFPSLVFLPYLAKQQIDFTNKEAILEFAKTDPTAVLLQIVSVIPAHIFTLFLAWLVVTRFRKYSFREMLGWKWGGFNVLHGLAILGGFFIIAAVTSYFVPEQDNDLLRMLKTSRGAVIAIAFLATFTAPLVEEVVYRGLLYSALQRGFGLTTSVILTTLFFAAVHVPQYYPSFSTIFLICLLSLVLTLVRVKTGNLLPCVVLHTIFNGIQSILLILQPYFPENPADLPEKTASVIHLFK
ncbi:MAG TPA: CPBP family intramembrane glutamic endopeptidase [Pyrinomonadaceae bacterium]|nr:CPBP family intramembrane glutamic endopeptidase [Pyrinomonadaceae bacterium]